MVNDAGVDLGGGEFGVAQHFADCLDGYTVGVGYGRCECVASEVRGYPFLDTQCGGYLFEVEVVLGVADNRQQVASDAFRF